MFPTYPHKLLGLKLKIDCSLLHLLMNWLFILPPIQPSLPLFLHVEAPQDTNNLVIAWPARRATSSCRFFFDLSAVPPPDCPHLLFLPIVSIRTTKMAATKSPPPSLGLKDIYLIFYNAACALGWAYVLVLGIPSFFNSVASSDASLVDALKNAGSDMYFATPATAGWSDEAAPSLATVLTIVQSAAILEIIHAALGLVRSPVFVTTMQVGSRIVALHMVNASPKAQSKSHAILLDAIYIVIYIISSSEY